jgi:glycolate oxidase
VVFPESEDQVSGVLALCHRHRVPVTPRGAGVGFSGGCVPARGGVVLVLTRLNRILEIDPDNLVAVVEPGVVTQELQDAARRHGLFYPPDPASVRSSTIGGNVAECAGGLSAVKYGVTKHYVLGMRFVLPDGRRGEIGGKTVKNVAGYDLLGLLVGSEGTLAVMTRFTLKLLPLPAARRTLLVGYPGIEEAGASVSRIIRSRVIPTALELMDRASIDAVERILPSGIPPETRAVLLVELDGQPADIAAGEEALREVLRQSAGTILRAAADDAERERIWDFRRAISPAIARLGSLKINEDIVVPRSEIPAIIRIIESVSMKYNLNIISFGHAGDGNIHVNILIGRENPSERERATRAVTEVLEAAISLGGAISGEHGIGLTKRDFLPINLSPEVLDISLRIKRAFDPRGILNPGKIFPDPS